MSRYWLSEPPKQCDGCANDIDKIFVDGKTTLGPWACLCQTCYELGPGIGKLGPGLGQQYTKQTDGRFLKTGG